MADTKLVWLHDKYAEDQSEYGLPYPEGHDFQGLLLVRIHGTVTAVGKGSGNVKWVWRTHYSGGQRGIEETRKDAMNKVEEYTHPLRKDL